MPRTPGGRLEPVKRAARDVDALRVAVVRFRHRGLRAEDAFLASYPKSGNTWLRFMLGHLIRGRELGFDDDTEVVPMVGSHRGAPRRLPGGGRLIKSHEPYRSLYGDRYGRVVYVVRDGRDVAVSYYFTLLRRGDFEGDFSTFLERFRAGRVDGYGPWDAHVRSWLGSRVAREGRLHVVRYEDMLGGPLPALAGACEFLSLDASPAALREAVEVNTAEQMRKRESGSRFQDRQARRDISFVRKAAPGSWRETMSAEDRDRFHAWCGDLLAELGYMEEKGTQPAEHEAS